MERMPRQRRKHSKAACIIHAVPDDLLRLILLRLDSPLWLLRAACAWRRFRDVVAGDDGGRAFLRLARSLHPPAVVGHYDERSSNRRHITFVPSSPPAPIGGGRFCLDFLPRVHIETGNWAVADCHGGLVLLREGSRSLPNLIVCHPLTRRYRRIYHPPGDRAVYDSFSRTFLLDGGDGSISMSNFRVLYRSNRGPRGCVFSTADGDDWRFLMQSARDDDGGWKGDIAGRIDGSLYLGLPTGSVIVLDNASLEFSQVDLPIRVDTSDSKYRSSFRVVHGAGGDPTTPPTTWIVHVHGQELECFRLVRRTGEWMLEHSIPLLDAVHGLPAGLPKHRVVIADGTGTAALLAWDGYGRSSPFLVNLYTMELQVAAPKEEAAYRYTSATFNYTLPWPQFLPPI